MGHCFGLLYSAIPPTLMLDAGSEVMLERSLMFMYTACKRKILSNRFTNVPHVVQHVVVSLAGWSAFLGNIPWRFIDDGGVCSLSGLQFRCSEFHLGRMRHATEGWFADEAPVLWSGCSPAQCRVRASDSLSLNQLKRLFNQLKHFLN